MKSARKTILTDVISYDRVRELLDYDPETGELTWKVRLSPKRGPGEVAGHKSRTATTIMIDKRLLRAHRIIWLWMTGETPTMDIDHINRDPNDNRWSNLRLATPSQNLANVMRKWHELPTGVTRNRTGNGKPFLAKICMPGVRGYAKYLGSFNTAEEARDAWVVAAREKYGEEFLPR